MLSIEMMLIMCLFMIGIANAFLGISLSNMKGNGIKMIPKRFAYSSVSKLNMAVTDAPPNLADLAEVSPRDQEESIFALPLDEKH